jgi:hypothetical protein
MTRKKNDASGLRMNAGTRVVTSDELRFRHRPKEGTRYPWFKRRYNQGKHMLDFIGHDIDGPILGLCSIDRTKKRASIGRESRRVSIGQKKSEEIPTYVYLWRTRL